MKKTIESVIKYFILIFGLFGWSLLFFFVLSSLGNNGKILLNFNKYNETIFEFFLFLGIIICFIIVIIYELRKDLRR